MKKYIYILLSILLMEGYVYADNAKKTVSSPDGRINVVFAVNNEGRPYYNVSFKDEPIIGNSFIAFRFKKAHELKNHIQMIDAQTRSVNEKWSRKWGPTIEVADHYNMLSVQLQEESRLGRRFNIIFKVYDNGLGFRYEFPEQKNLKDVQIMDEQTEFQLTGDNSCWWTPGDWDSYEHLYSHTKFSKIDDTPYLRDALISSYIPDIKAVSTPITMKTKEGTYLSFHEANLANYAGMTLSCNAEALKMTSALVAWEDGVKVKTKTPFVTPWRTIQISESPAGLIESNLIENLNDECKIEDTDWIHPQKYIGLWWAMHIGQYDWEMENNNHGTTTERSKEYIDFASKNGIESLLIEGWNDQHVEWIKNERKTIFDWVTAYPDFNFQEVVDYARSKGVKIIGQHETNGMVGNYMRDIDKAYDYFNQLGIETVKSGYVGQIIPATHYQQGQWMVENYRTALEKAAKHKLMLFVHETIKPTGLCRTYPNLMAEEAARGQEFNAWGKPGNNPSHTLILPFTRMLAGTMDFTPGIFDIKLEKYRENNQIPTTLAKQLALFVVFYSPVQMAADIIENYENNPAFQFIRDVPVDWDAQKVVNAEIGEYVTIARKEKGTKNWALGSITNESAREFDIPLSFLNDGITYSAFIYADGKDASWDKNPLDYSIHCERVTNQTVLKVKLAKGGGQAIYFKAME
ncbi:glycoside hydrolase family 97 protein [Prolixibacter sp. SD074]|uniref:glycoside hydrolase family 97 protein n=1 Tax=Prolixibacter sp. SD074 TaxID=2652391 RepID=UPI00127B3850|nr:glycoside hydrolase family 97 protein [Prolixibacter sp. SD074]GET28957.1 alpha-glucosidase [Prolixibacter sp. SD074]